MRLNLPTFGEAEIMVCYSGLKADMTGDCRNEDLENSSFNNTIIVIC
jgi:hypothetical protein